MRQKAIDNDLIVGADEALGLGVVPDSTELCLAELGERAFGPAAFGWRQLDHLLDALGHRNGAAAAGFGDPERDAMFLDVVPDQPECFAKTASGVDQEDGKPVGILTAASDGGKKPCLFLSLEEANPSRPLLLAAELGQAVDISHLVSLAQQFAEGSHLSIDGCVAVAALAQGADKVIKGTLVNGAETLPKENFIYFANERADIVFMPPIIPQYVPVN